MRKIYLIIIVLIFATTSKLSAQQLPLYSQYMFNHMLINPAVTGSTEGIDLKLLARQQWVGIDKGPSTQLISGHTSLVNGTMGVGGIIFADRFGPETKIGLQGNYSYIIPVFGESAKLAFGLSLQVFQYQMNYADLTYLDAEDPELNFNKENAWLPESDFGIYLYSEKYFAGISGNQLLELPVKIGNSYIDRSNANTLSRHYHLLGGYKFNLSGQFALEPSTLLKTTFKSPFQADINVRGIYKKDYWLGLSYRTDGAIVTLLGLTYKDFIFGFAFDYATSKLSNFQAGTFELMLGYNIIKDPYSGRSRY
jgi:type IX secretion system PorP/SprF family membrane protein